LQPEAGLLYIRTEIAKNKYNHMQCKNENKNQLSFVTMVIASLM